MKSNKGITLITLVITVIVLLILAGITLGMVIGENGIIKKAMEAKENTIQASKKEEEVLNRLWEEMENGGENIGDGSSQEDKNDESDAEEKHILTGYKAYSGGKLLTGTMPNRGSIKIDLNAGESYTVLEGYHNGEGKVTAKDLASQTVATAIADNITEGKTAWVNGELITGTGKDNIDAYEQGSQQNSKLTKVKLGTVNGIYGGQTKTFNCTNIPNYKNLTNDNFTYTLGGTTYLYWKTYEANTSSEKTVTLSGAPQISYNSAKGILTVTMGGANYHNYSQVFSGVYPGFTFYCIY